MCEFEQVGPSLYRAWIGNVVAFGESATSAMCAAEAIHNAIDPRFLTHKVIASVQGLIGDGHTH